MKYVLLFLLNCLPLFTMENHYRSLLALHEAERCPLKKINSNVDQGFVPTRENYPTDEYPYLAVGYVHGNINLKLYELKNNDYFQVQEYSKENKKFFQLNGSVVCLKINDATYEIDNQYCSDPKMHYQFSYSSFDGSVYLKFIHVPQNKDK